ncbi:MAG: PaaX family transcriptional regulator C-terminal domain-containing protein [Anaerolineales bacterium]
MSSRPPIRTQIVIFTLFGEYVVPLGGTVWTAGLLKLMGLLEVTERAARSTLSRMSQKGWLASTRVGRYSHYALTPRGHRIVEEGGVRIFEPRRMSWDELWHMVVYSIPEQKRRLRGRLRQRLGWLGFGYLAPGTWISPNDRAVDVRTDLEDLGATEYAQYFSGMKLHFASQEDIVNRCWDLATLNQDYARFLKRYEPGYRKVAKRIKSLDPAESFVQRFWLTLEYLQFPRRDPNLPPALQPNGWLGTQASQMFQDYHELLKEPSDSFVAEVLNTNPLEEAQFGFQPGAAT